jgi:hypothetical protein
MRTLHRPSIFLSLLLAAAPVLAQSARVAAEPRLTGSLRTADGIDVLYLHGSLEERGFTEGYLTADRIVKLFRDFALSDRVIPNPGLWNLLVVPRTRKLVEVPDWVRPWAAALLEGIEARDADLLEIPELNRDLGVDDLVACATLPDFLGLACSSFVAWGDRVAGAGPLVGRNLDYFATDELLKQTMVIVRAPREGRAGWVSIGWPGIAGCLTGISEHGVSAAIHDVPAKAVQGTKITPRPLALQELIETFAPAEAPAEEAAAILRRFRYGMGGNFMVGWKAGAAHGPGGAVYEVWPSQEVGQGVTPRGPAEGQTWVSCSNHHRARVEPEQRCWRYLALYDGVKEAETPLDLAGARALIRESEVKGTLYQVSADLATGELALRLRRKPREDEFSEVASWNAYALLRAVAAAAPAEPAALGSGR